MEIISEYCIPIVTIGCLVIGYVMKNFMPTDNKWIPLVLAIIGAILGIWANMAVTIESIVGGAVSGLCAVGLHQVFKQYIENKDTIDE